MTPEARTISGITLITVPSIQYGGYFLLKSLVDRNSRYMDNPLRQNVFRAGHAHAGVIVVDTVSLRGPPWTWLDTAGHQHSDAIHVIERFRRTADTIEYEYTVDDPIMYAKP